MAERIRDRAGGKEQKRLTRVRLSYWSIIALVSLSGVEAEEKRAACDPIMGRQVGKSRFSEE